MTVTVQGVPANVLFFFLTVSLIFALLRRYVYHHTGRAVADTDSSVGEPPE